MKKRLNLIASKKIRKNGTMAMILLLLLTTLTSVSAAATRPVEFAPSQWHEDKDGNMIREIMPMNEIYYASENIVLVKKNESCAVAYDIKNDSLAFQIDFWLLGITADYDDPIVVQMSKDETVVRFYQASKPETVFKYYVKDNKITANDSQEFIPASDCERVPFYTGTDKTLYFDSKNQVRQLADLNGWTAEEGIRIADDTICYLVNVNNSTASGEALRLCVLSENGSCDVNEIPMNSNATTVLLPEGYKGGLAVAQRLALSQKVQMDWLDDFDEMFTPKYTETYDEQSGETQKTLKLLETVLMPVRGEIIAHFGDVIPEYADEKDVYGKTPYFDGIEIAAAAGTPVVSAADGKVYDVIDGDFATNEGTMIVIRHSYNEFTVYGSLGEVNVKEGDVVKAGQQIAKVGTTSAHTEKPHLYFSLLKENGAENIEELLK